MSYLVHFMGYVSGAAPRQRPAPDNREVARLQQDGTTPYGYCKCGCGQRTKLAPRTITRFGYVKGEPYPWVRGHGHRKQYPPYQGDGLCQCGCGGRTPLAKATKGGNVKGQPIRFLHGHSRRGHRKPGRYEVCDMGYETPCWVWLLAKNADGYGSTSQGGAHRVAYVERYGPIPEGLTVDHLCFVRACVNPDHLEAVTFEENIRRAYEHGSFAGRHVPRCPHCQRFIGPGGCRRCGNEASEIPDPTDPLQEAALRAELAVELV